MLQHMQLLQKKYKWCLVMCVSHYSGVSITAACSGSSNAALFSG